MAAPRSTKSHRCALQVKKLNRPKKCEACSDIIWSFSKVLHCSACGFLAHKRCYKLAQRRCCPGITSKLANRVSPLMTGINSKLGKIASNTGLTTGALKLFAVSPFNDQVYIAVDSKIKVHTVDRIVGCMNPFSSLHGTRAKIRDITTAETSDDEAILAVATDTGCAVYNIRNLLEVRYLHHSKPLYRVEATENYIACSDGNFNIVVWSNEGNGSFVLTDMNAFTCSISISEASSELMAINKKGLIKVWDVGPMREVVYSDNKELSTGAWNCVFVDKDIFLVNEASQVTLFVRVARNEIVRAGSYAVTRLTPVDIEASSSSIGSGMIFLTYIPSLTSFLVGHADSGFIEVVQVSITINGAYEFKKTCELGDGTVKIRGVDWTVIDTTCFIYTLTDDLEVHCCLLDVPAFKQELLISPLFKNKRRTITFPSNRDDAPSNKNKSDKSTKVPKFTWNKGTTNFSKSYDKGLSSKINKTLDLRRSNSMQNMSKDFEEDTLTGISDDEVSQGKDESSERSAATTGSWRSKSPRRRSKSPRRRSKSPKPRLGPPMLGSPQTTRTTASSPKNVIYITKQKTGRKKTTRAGVDSSGWVTGNVSEQNPINVDNMESLIRISLVRSTDSVQVKQESVSASEEDEQPNTSEKDSASDSGTSPFANIIIKEPVYRKKAEKRSTAIRILDEQFDQLKKESLAVFEMKPALPDFEDTSFSVHEPKEFGAE